MIYYAATTLDGFIADQHDSLDWLLRQPQDEGGPLNYEDFIAGIGAIVMGSNTYRWIVENLASAGESWPYTMPAWVMSSDPPEPLDGASIRFATGDVRAVHHDMQEAASGKDLWVVGGGDLAGQFADAELLDEVVTFTAPVTLGKGRPLLPRRLDLELVDAARNGAFNCARYRVVGRLKEDA